MKIVKLLHRVSQFLLAFGLAGVASAQNVQLIGVMPNMGVFKIDGVGPKSIRIGQSYNGVKVVSASGDSAVIEIDGKRSTIRLGDAGFSSDTNASSGQKTTLTADSNGHFVTTIAINGRPVEAVVDTGATVISIGRSQAEQMGIKYQNAPQAVFGTANGSIRAWMVKFDTVRVGNITLYQVEGSVNESNMPIVLLGMSFLNRVEMKRSNGQLELIKR
ncbi:retroviral-like aspartic protease family protein [Leeia sp. TBRC 13508]|uniref:Retroviral-like aspartic protease family protein n=1 Tax=Leeia speluncae TaxID=2884804 RepID=A0ABS8DAW6_9NEIS|nr:retropepsin-like aspartic protease [Leeia speluncae]MCB6185362.1 retroviral-like aspartic protease family protein [Leeia speluncae]